MRWRGRAGAPSSRAPRALPALHQEHEPLLRRRARPLTSPSLVEPERQLRDLAEHRAMEAPLRLDALPHEVEQRPHQLPAAVLVSERRGRQEAIAFDESERVSTSQWVPTHFKRPRYPPACAGGSIYRCWGLTRAWPTWR